MQDSLSRQYMQRHKCTVLPFQLSTSQYALSPNGRLQEEPVQTAMGNKTDQTQETNKLFLLNMHDMLLYKYEHSKSTTKCFLLNTTLH